MSTRFAADSSLPPPVERVGAEPHARRGAEQARRLLRGRTGWFGVRSDRLRMFFVVHHAWETHVTPTTSFVKKGGRSLFFNERFSSTVAWCPLAEAEGVQGDVEVFEAVMGGTSDEKGIELASIFFRQVTVPKRAP